MGERKDLIQPSTPEQRFDLVLQLYESDRQGSYLEKRKLVKNLLEKSLENLAIADAVPFLERLAQRTNTPIGIRVTSRLDRQTIAENLPEDIRPFKKLENRTPITTIDKESLIQRIISASDAIENKVFTHQAVDIYLSYSTTIFDVKYSDLTVAIEIGLSESIHLRCFTAKDGNIILQLIDFSKKSRAKNHNMGKIYITEDRHPVEDSEYCILKEVSLEIPRNLHQADEPKDELVFDTKSESPKGFWQKLRRKFSRIKKKNDESIDIEPEKQKTLSLPEFRNEFAAEAIKLVYQIIK